MGLDEIEYEKKQQTLEKEKTDALEVATQKNEKRKEEEKSSGSIK